MDAKTYDLDIYTPSFDIPNVVDCALLPDPFKPINIETKSSYNYHCANDILNFDGWSIKYHIEIIDMNNKLIYKQQNVDYLNYNLSHLSHGIYLLKITSTLDNHTDIIKLAK